MSPYSGRVTPRRHSPAVYRRRRLMVLLIALIVIAGIVWLLIAQPWRAIGAMVGEDEPTPSPTATATEAGETPSPSPSPTETEDGPPKECDPKVIVVEPLTDKTEYGSDEKPKLSMRLTNSGDVDCTFNVGTTQQVFTVTSGSDVWWRSTDCQSKPSDSTVTLKAGQKVKSAEPLVWDRTRSSVDSCGDESRPVAGAGGATYGLSVKIGDVESESARSFILR